MLKDDTMIDQLALSKITSTEIGVRVADSKITEKEIDETREGYRPVAFRASLLFFCILDLCTIDPMYQYSLQWFITLFCMGCENAPVANDLETRLENLKTYFTYSLYENICRSLFELHKLLFSFLLTNKILQSRQEMNPLEWRHMLTGATGDIKVLPNPTSWIDQNSWDGIYKQFKGLEKVIPNVERVFMEKIEQFKIIYDSNRAHEEVLPSPLEETLTPFQKMLVLKCLRPDKVVPAVQNFISSKMGRQYIIFPNFDIAKCFKDASIVTPLIFVLSTGSDPVADFKKFAEEQGMGKRYQTISLGQGQGPRAEKMIREETAKGGWVLL